MSTPPSSPLVSHDAIVALKNATADPTSPAARAAAPIALAFESTCKRHSSDGRDSTVDGVHSPTKKRPDTPLSAIDDAPMDIDIDSELMSDLRIDEQRPSSRSFPLISLSPNESTAVAAPDVQPPPVAAAPPVRKQTKKKKAAPAAKPLDTSNNSCFTFIREEVFDTKLFSRGKAEIYSHAEMEKFDSSFQKQLIFNFSERRATKKKLESVGHISRSQAFNLDENLDVFSGRCTSCRDLSTPAMSSTIIVTMPSCSQSQVFRTTLILSF
jgi:hypothetical protein